MEKYELDLIKRKNRACLDGLRDIFATLNQKCNENGSIDVLGWSKSISGIKFYYSWNKSPVPNTELTKIRYPHHTISFFGNDKIYTKEAGFNLIDLMEIILESETIIRKRKNENNIFTEDLIYFIGLGEVEEDNFKYYINWSSSPEYTIQVKPVDLNPLPVYFE